jgi:hypothetical protein
MRLFHRFYMEIKMPHPIVISLVRLNYIKKGGQHMLSQEKRWLWDGKEIDTS